MDKTAERGSESALLVVDMLRDFTDPKGLDFYPTEPRNPSEGEEGHRCLQRCRDSHRLPETLQQGRQD